MPTKIRVIKCDLCNRRRRVTISSLPKEWFYRCSQGHTWSMRKLLLHEAEDMLRKHMIDMIRQYLAQDNSLLRFFQ
jgi:hypothetical protein